MMTECISFCVDQLLWMLAWGWYQLVFGVLLSWIAYMFLGRIKMMSALILALSSYAFAMFVYFAFVAGICVHYFQWKFAVGSAPRVYSPLYASLILSVIYSILQLFFYCIINYWRKMSLFFFFVISLVCNIIAALLASSFIKISF